MSKEITFATIGKKTEAQEKRAVERYAKNLLAEHPEFDRVRIEPVGDGQTVARGMYKLTMVKE